jgi:hypothetical protein
VLGRAGEAGHARRLAEAENGNITWQTPPEIRRFVEKLRKETRENPTSNGMPESGESTTVASTEA